MRLKILFIAMLFPFIFACTSASTGTDIKVPSRAKDDDQYYPILQKWHKNSSIISNFQKKMDLDVVLISDKFKQAYLDRVVKIRGETINLLQTNYDNDISFFISISTPERAFEDLGSRKIWNIELLFGSNKFLEPMVKSVTEKELFEPFFPFVSKWSKDYLVSFSAAKEAPKWDTSQPIKLIMHSNLTAVTIEWNN